MLVIATSCLDHKITLLLGQLLSVDVTGGIETASSVEPGILFANFQTKA